MLKLFEKLFASATSEGSSHNQTQREATIDLLLLAIYADNHISFDENQVLENSVAGLGWDSGTSVSIYMNSATTQAREALANEESQNQFLDSIATRLNSSESKEKALSLLSQLFDADGTSVEEEAFYKTVESKLT